MTFKNYSGTLTDDRIEKLCEKGILIAQHYKKENIVQACYELTASSIYYDVNDNFKRIDIVEDGYDYILIKPKQSVVIITQEELNVPPDIIGRVLTKGKLFSIGLSPVNTYADPGFKGNLGIVLYNNSINYLKLKAGSSVAKIEFSALQEEVSNPYSGQHGYKTSIWPIPVEYSLTKEEEDKDLRIRSAADEISQIYGSRYTGVISRLLVVEKKLLLAAAFYFIFSILLITFLVGNSNSNWLTYLLAVGLGLVTNILSFVFIFWLEKTKLFGGRK